MVNPHPGPTVAEFFAGIGLVRMAIERVGGRVVFANDIDRTKHDIYAANFDASCFRLCDIREIHAADVPDVDIATASFPCTDVSVAGNRDGLEGEESGTLWEFLRVLQEMGGRRPPVVMLENVIGFATSNGGEDLRATIAALNTLGYVCDILVLDGRWFLPQSRPRLFIVGASEAIGTRDEWNGNPVRPKWLKVFADRHPELRLHPRQLPLPPTCPDTIADVVEQIPHTSDIWWDVTRLGAFLVSLSPMQATRLEAIRRSDWVKWASAYRRTRKSKPVWEIRADAISGCLRTAKGGSSRQALVEAGLGDVRVRWMTPREYCRLQGAPGLQFGQATDSQIKTALGDAVCVPAVTWLADHYLVPLA